MNSPPLNVACNKSTKFVDVLLCPKSIDGMDSSSLQRYSDNMACQTSVGISDKSVIDVSFMKITDRIIDVLVLFSGPCEMLSATVCSKKACENHLVNCVLQCISNGYSIGLLT
ncbi:hypothetical protein CEXT_638861 [Caerostris extrusa]|uniref:Uncharacterized protein n=1 Tax=Caerostris extrusa TaxID=172846 RepID=A0AAV4X871_CAEEX|nr:hypothetical protein CEXT_638861 [Caerostris extrusa]